MSSARDKLVGDMGEARLIESIRSWLGAANPPPPHGMGDDCAVLPSSGRRRGLVTVDPVIRGRHFDQDASPGVVAAKLLNRNLSDIAAMGGRPTGAVVALAAPSDLPVAWLRVFFRSLGRLALRSGLVIVGGDCSQTDGFLGAFLTLFGRAPRRPLLRTGAQEGDLLFVTGSLGGSILGKHLRFHPRLEEGEWLAERGSVHAAIDLSDGLGKDLFPLIPPGMTAVVSTRRLPISPAARRLARQTDRPVLDCVFNDGEDHELLFAVDARSAEALSSDWGRRFKTRLTRIGRLKRRTGNEPRLILDPPPPDELLPRGYEHFR